MSLYLLYACVRLVHGHSQPSAFRATSRAMDGIVNQRRSFLCCFSKTGETLFSNVMCIFQYIDIGVASHLSRSLFFFLVFFFFLLRCRHCRRVPAYEPHILRPADITANTVNAFKWSLWYMPSIVSLDTTIGTAWLLTMVIEPACYARKRIQHDTAVSKAMP